MKICRFLIVMVLLVIQPSIYANESAKSESISIINSIVEICKEQGMLACEPSMKGIDIIFEYIRLFDQVSQLDAKFAEFLKTNYPESSGLDFDVIQASLKLSLDITFTPEQFASRITNAEKVANGYDVTMDNGPVLQLRKQDNKWIVIFPPSMLGQFKSLEPFYLAGKLKRSILIYRMLEADMANLSKDKLESNVSEDIAPILVALFPKEKLPNLMKWLVKDVNEVVSFYSQFSTVNDMKAHIIKTHKLS